MINDKELKALGFVLTHEITSAGALSALPEFREIASHSSQNKSSVYLWLSPSQTNINSYEVLYVGKAGYGTTRRFSQHRGGFRKSNPGSNCALILEKFAAKRKILVFGKVADEIDLFGVTVSRYSVEEEALCKHLSPLWNRAGFPDSTKSKKNGQIASAKCNKIIRNIEFLGEDTSLWYKELKKENQVRFAKVLSYAESIDILREIPQKIICGYSKQPSGYNSIPMIVYGKFAKSGKVAANGWMLRIPQPTSKNIALTLFIPYCFAAKTVESNMIERHGLGNQEFFNPIDLDHFLQHPQAYIDWNNPDTRQNQRKIN
jgi:hypothetical protein